MALRSSLVPLSVKFVLLVYCTNNCWPWLLGSCMPRRELDLSCFAASLRV